MAMKTTLNNKETLKEKKWKKQGNKKNNNQLKTMPDRPKNGVANGKANGSMLAVTTRAMVPTTKTGQRLTHTQIGRDNRVNRHQGGEWYRMNSSGNSNSGDSQHAWGNYRQSRNYAQSGVSISRDQRGRDDDGHGRKPGDSPPTWDGKDPQRNVRQYIKMMNLWLKTTRTKKDCQGYVSFNAAKGDLKELYDGLDENELAAEDCP